MGEQRTLRTALAGIALAAALDAATPRYHEPHRTPNPAKGEATTYLPADRTWTKDGVRQMYAWGFGSDTEALDAWVETFWKENRLTKDLIEPGFYIRPTLGEDYGKAHR